MSLENFSFVVPKRLAGMAKPGKMGNLEEDIRLLLEKGISAMVSLTEYGLSRNLLESYNIAYLHLPVEDFGVPTIDQVIQFVEFVDNMAKEGKAVVVHCHAGLGRTGTMLACYLVRLGREPQEAIWEVRSLRPGSIETLEQEGLIHSYFRYLKG